MICERVDQFLESLRAKYRQKMAPAPQRCICLVSPAHLRQGVSLLLPCSSFAASLLSGALLIILSILERKASKSARPLEISLFNKFIARLAAVSSSNRKRPTSVNVGDIVIGPGRKICSPSSLSVARKVGSGPYAISDSSKSRPISMMYTSSATSLVNVESLNILIPRRFLAVLSSVLVSIESALIYVVL
jgi:hypothetical protein